jgi:hypothetical protein
MDGLRAAKSKITEVWESGADALRVPLASLDKFLQHISLSSNGECWLWTGKPLPDGSGQFTCPRRNQPPEGSRVHRLMYELLKRREVPPNVDIVQKCGKKLCLRPDHLTERPRGGKGSRGGSGAYKKK